jgi:nucleoside-diphosphate-sugar epimerase
MSGTVLRYGWFYGPGTSYDPKGAIPTALRNGTMPIVGTGAGTYSFIHLEDAVAATMKALALPAAGIYNIVDDSPVRMSEWLPFAARLLGAPAPGREDEASARKRIGDMRVYYQNEQRGASNAKAKRELDWRPAFPSWRAGFEALYLAQRG